MKLETQLNARSADFQANATAMRALVDRLSPIVTQLIGMTRACVDHYDETLGDDLWPATDGPRGHGC